jgi:hypothetical protein
MLGEDAALINVGPNFSASNNSCFARAWVGHEFRLVGTSQSHARVDVMGTIAGSWGSPGLGISTRDPITVSVEARLEELDPLLGQYEVLAQNLAFSRVGADLVVNIDEVFVGTLQAVLTGGRTYRVTILLAVQVPGTLANVDLGPPGSGHGARIDSIEVCIDPPPDDSAITSRLDALELADLEAKLYRKECMPGVWMPVAQGGKLETARQLVADRLAQATATNDPNVNARVAAMRLQAADADITAGQYQHACRDLADGLHALTTP